MAEIRIAIIGFGKIALDQHVPAIAANPAFKLVAAVAPRGTPSVDAPIFKDHGEMLRQVRPDAVAICTPPAPRHAIARDCLDAGAHVLLEKPPGVTLGEVNDLARLCEQRRRSLFTTWHAQYNDGVREAARLIAEQGLRSLRIDWLEDVEKWHPGQQWIWQPGGFGVFDAGINALSIATLLSPSVLLLRKARMDLHSDGQQPIAAMLTMESPGVAGPIEALLDWRHKGEERWTIEATTLTGTRLMLSEGGAVLRIGDGDPRRGTGREYPALYARFEQLVRARESHVDVEPLRLTADAFLLAERVTAD
ncbi:Gfo/Idh/MocA family protein [Rhizorhabdus argentea]|uniref:Gfo/Idh/MocA family protein n=1 Tax=Rhizorhabdus argentea TaxID=1387174 RepID=UPI0030EF1084